MSLRPPWEIRRTVIVRAEEETDPRFGCPPEERPMDRYIRFGVINLDKPPGPTSHEVVSWVKRILELERAGHGGTLDPKVTGVLPITLEEATKVVQALLESGKEYVCIMRTHDEEREERVVETLKLFEGKIYQRPPIRASVKRRLRTRTIYRIEYLEGDGRNWLFKVACESGTYIRKLCMAGDTELILSNGEILRIEDFADKFCNSFGSFDVCGEYRTLSFNDMHYVNNKILKVQKLPSPDILVKIRTSSGSKIKLTKDHDVLVSTEDGPIWRCAGDLRRGDLIFAPSKLNIDGESPYIVDLLDEDFPVGCEGLGEEIVLGLKEKYGNIGGTDKMLNIDIKSFKTSGENFIEIKYVKAFCDWNKIKEKINKLKVDNEREIGLRYKIINEGVMYLLGLLASSGCIMFDERCITSSRIKFHNSEENLIRKFVEIHEEIFPSIPISLERGVSDVMEVDVRNPVLASIAHSLGMVSPKENADFKPIFRLPEPLIRSFLRGYFDGAGTAKIFRYKNRCVTNISFYAVNENIARRLYLLLKRIGINGKIIERKIYGSSASDDSRYNVVRLRSPIDKLKFIREIGSNHPRKMEKLERMEKILMTIKFKNQEYCPLHVKKLINKMLVENGLNLGRIFEKVLSADNIMTKSQLEMVIRKLEKMVDGKILEPLRSILNSPFYVEKVEEVEEIESDVEYVYDITVEEPHNFIPEGSIVVSNCFDAGEVLGIGAHMHELRRVRSGPFDETELFTVYDLVDAVGILREEGDERPLRRVVKPMETALRLLPKVWIRDSAVEAICSGASLAVPGILRFESGIVKGSTVAVLTQKGEGVALMRAEMTGEQMAEAERGIAATPLRVLMPRGTYPRMW